jgi:hypothetical protein
LCTAFGGQDGHEIDILLSVSEAVVGGEHYFTATVRDLSNELLLMNMLPKSIAARLQAKESPINDGHENVSILFADICGFTALSSKLTPFEVVSFLNDIFNIFDEVCACVPVYTVTMRLLILHYGELSFNYFFLRCVESVSTFPNKKYSDKYGLIV